MNSYTGDMFDHTLLGSITPAELTLAAAQLVSQHRDCQLVKNQVGNLTILAPDGCQLGYLDLRTAVVEMFDDPISELDTCEHQAVTETSALAADSASPSAPA